MDDKKVDENVDEVVDEVVDEKPEEKDEEKKDDLEVQANELDAKEEDVTHVEEVEDVAPPSAMVGSANRRILYIFIAIIIFVVGAIAAWVLLTTETSSNDEDNQVADTEETVFNQGAVLTYIEGDVEVYNGLSWVTAAPGDNVRYEDGVRTGDDSRAIVALDDGSALRLDANSEVTLDTLTTTEVVVTNVSGEVYARVSDSETREFVVLVDETKFEALGTAYRTHNTDDQKGVEVFQSEVEVDDETKVEEGKEYYKEHPNKDKKDKSSSIDLDKLKDDDFIAWNKKQDEKETSYKDKLGVLKDLDKEEEPEEEEEPEPTTPTAKITASASAREDGIKVSWTNSGIYAADGYKVVYSKKDSTPTYGEDSNQYASPESKSLLLKDLTNGNKWYIRVCAYRKTTSGKTCSSYSNTVTVTAKTVEPEMVTRGTMTSDLDGSVLEWSYGEGVAPHGYKVVWGTDPEPRYPGDSSKLIGGNSLDLSYKITEPGSYYVTVCAYATNKDEEAPCLDYATDVTYTVD